MGRAAKWVVRLDAAERAELETLLVTPRAAAERVLRARVLLKADEGADGPAWSDTQIADAFGGHCAAASIRRGAAKAAGGSIQRAAGWDLTRSMNVAVKDHAAAS